MTKLTKLEKEIDFHLSHLDLIKYYRETGIDFLREKELTRQFIGNNRLLNLIKEKQKINYEEIIY